MSEELADLVRRLQAQVAEADARAELLRAAMQGLLTQMNPNAEIVARRFARRAAVTTIAQRFGRPSAIRLFDELFPGEKPDDADFIPVEPS